MATFSGALWRSGVRRTGVRDSPTPCLQSPLHPQAQLHLGGEELLPLCKSTGLLGDILCNGFYPPHPPSLLPWCSPSSWAQCPVLFHVLQPPDGLSAFPSQIRTSTPRGTRAAGSGRWGGSGGDKPWAGAPTPAGPGSQAAQPLTRSPTLPGRI